MVDVSIELLKAYLHDELTEDATREIELVLAHDSILRQTVASLRVEATGIQSFVDAEEDEQDAREADLRAQALEAAAASSADEDTLIIAATEERADDISGLIDLRSMTQPIDTSKSGDGFEEDLVNVRPSVPPLMTPQPPKSFPWRPIALATSVAVLTILGTILVNWLQAPNEAEIAKLDAKIEMLNARLASLDAESGTTMALETALILQEIEDHRAQREARPVVIVQEEEPADEPEEAPQIDPKRTTKVAAIEPKQSPDAPDAPDAAVAPKPVSGTEPVIQLPKATPKGDLNNLLGQVPPNTESSLPPPANPSSDLSEIPETLTKNQVRSGLEKVAQEVAKCTQGQAGVLKVKLVISGANGRVESAQATGTLQGTASGACVERVVKMARFMSFRKPSLKVTYPFNIVGVSTNPYGTGGTEPLTVSRVN